MSVLDTNTYSSCYIEFVIKDPNGCTMQTHFSPICYHILRIKKSFKTLIYIIIFLKVRLVTQLIEENVYFN